MPTYLVHQRRDGTPMGIFSETDHFYFPQFADRASYGTALIKARGSRTQWAEWAEEQASRSPGPGGMWDIFEAADAPLEAVLRLVRDRTVSTV